jgi:2'-5' RNA ligase
MAEKKNDKRIQYFIAVIPPSPFFDEALKIKQYFQERYNSKGALKSPPHITLHMPFKWKEEKEKVLIKKLEEFAGKFSPLEIAFNGFNCFPPRVIYIETKESVQLTHLQKELMRFCKQELGLHNANYKDRPFRPHLTVAFRDLKKADFREAWEEFKEKKFEGSFAVDAIVLLKHNGKQWEVFRQFSFIPVP